MVQDNQAGRRLDQKVGIPGAVRSPDIAARAVVGTLVSLVVDCLEMVGPVVREKPPAPRQ